jgi:aminopeptidase YwaD
MKHVSILLIILLIFSYAGELESIQKDIIYLSSEICKGRGLSDGGIFQAEKYIINELESAGLDVKTQAVSYKQNVIIGSPMCVINGDTLQAGYDFIPHPFSSSADKLYTGDEIEFIDSTALENVMELKDLPSLSSARRYLIKKSTKKDREKLLLFSGEYPLMSRQSKKYPRAVLQVNDEYLNETPRSVYMYNDTDYKKVTTNNIITVIKGAEVQDSAICLTAHYDHMGAVGDVYYPGANDNASGVAVLLTLARYYAENPAPMTLVFCFFTGEEQGLKGSKQYLKQPVFPLKNMMMAINLDMVGSGLNGYGVVAGNDQPGDVSIFEDIREKYEIGNFKLRPNSPNSDHFPFTEKGVPALFFYASGGEQPYHHPDDIAETLDWGTIENTVSLMKEYIAQKIKE